MYNRRPVLLCNTRREGGYEDLEVRKTINISVEVIVQNI